MKIPKRTPVPVNSVTASLQANELDGATVPPPMDADRIALTNMFKAIAEYGRRVRLRRQSEGVPPAAETPQAGEGQFIAE